MQVKHDNNWYSSHKLLLSFFFSERQESYQKSIEEAIVNSQLKENESPDTNTP